MFYTTHVFAFVSVVAVVYLPPATKLGQGYIFTGVCHSVYRGGGGAWSGGSAPGGCLVETPSRRPLLRAVRILVACILVLFVLLMRSMFVSWTGESTESFHTSAPAVVNEPKVPSFSANLSLIFYY